MKRINIGEKQPNPCLHCRESHGYQYCDTYRMGYLAVHDSNGKYECGEYTDGKLLRKSSKPYCSNCGKLLPFRLNRTSDEKLKQK